MTGQTAQDDSYLMGRNPDETERLQKQALLYDGFTRALLQEAGIGPGMRVLDLGCGAGDVAMLAADLVGPTGGVVGLDKDPAILEVARGRARTKGLTQVSFEQGNLEQPAITGRFDAIIGRLVLIYLPNPAATLRSLATQLQGPAIVAFQDLDWGIGPLSTVRSPSLERLWYWVPETFKRAGLNARTGTSLREIFLAAGLPEPTMRLDAPVGGGPDFAGYDYMARGLRSNLPHILRLGVATTEEVDIDTFAERLRAEIVSQNGVLALPAFIGAWSNALHE